MSCAHWSILTKRERDDDEWKSLFKEHKLYQDEEAQLKRKLDKFIADNAEDWDIKNTVRA